MHERIVRQIACRSKPCHPCLKPRHFIRIIVRALLPLGEGMALDPFIGSGSTIAAAEAPGYDSTGMELDAEYFRPAERAISRLAALHPDFKGAQFEMEAHRDAAPPPNANQLDFAPGQESPSYAAAKRRPRPVAR